MNIDARGATITTPEEGVVELLTIDECGGPSSVCPSITLHIKKDALSHAPFKMVFSQSSPKEVLRIENDGRIFWNGREVESDDEFRKAMMEVAKWGRGEVR